MAPEPTMANAYLLTPALKHQTSVPLVKDGAGSETINVSVSSEFKEHSIPAAAIDARRKLAIVLDYQNQPIVFTIGSDARFYCIHHVTGDSWKLFDITPISDTAEVVAFDAYHHVNGTERKLAISVALKLPGSTYPKLYYSSVYTLSKDAFKPSAISYNKVKDKDLLITSISVGAADLSLTAAYFIVVGTVESGNKRASDYIADTGKSDPWKVLSIPEGSSKVLKVIPATQRSPIYGCIVTLYKKVLASSNSDLDAEDVGTAVSCLSLDGQYNIYILLKKLGGGARDIATTTTSKGRSDLYVAGVKGIGYYASQTMDSDPIVILPDVKFLQVLASEDNLKVSVLALSVTGELYFVEGKRESTAVVPKFTASGRPIRTNVQIISTQSNAAANACEMVYIDEDMVLKHLWRDTKTQMWTEQVIHVPITGRVVKFPAFLSQIRLSGSLGTAVANGHQVFLSSSEAAYAVVNDTSCRLEPTPRGFATDATGNLRVVIQARNELASPTITATLKNFNQSSSFTIQPRQRLLRQWGRFKSGSDLKNAKSTDGKPVFSSADKIDDASFDAVGGLLAKVPDVVAAVDPPSSVMITNTSGSSTSESSQVYSSHSDTSWMSGAQRVLNGIGDLLEGIWHGIEKVVKFGLKIVGKVADFFAEIRGKVLRFTMDSVGTVIRSVAAILKQALGIDVTRVIALFGFMWDYENIKKTQKIIVKTCKDGVVVLHDALKANASDMKTKVKSLRSDISSFVKEPDDAPGNDVVSTAVSIVKKSFIGKLLDQIFDNPIIHEITRFISLALLKVISLLDDFITFPGFAKLEAVVTSSFRTLLEKLGKDQADTFTKILQSVFNQASKVAAGQADVVTMLTAIFTDVFWGLYEAAEDVILALLDLLPDLIACGIDILTGVIKWPGVSTFWESFTELPFSFVDVGSLLVAQITYLITMIWKGKLPFDVMQPWYEWLPKDGSAIKLFKVTKKDETTKSEDNAGSTTVAASALPQLRVVRAAAAASDSPAQDTKEEAQSPSGSWVTFMDIVFNFLVSCATCGASACTVGSGIVAASNLPPGYTPVRPNNAAASAVSDAPTSAGCASFMNAERIFTVFGLTAETASLVTACFIPPNDSSLRERTVLVKLLALVLKGIALSSQYAISSVNYTLPPLAPLVNDCLPPLANILNSLPPGIWAYSESEKNEAAKMALAISFENSIAAGCDIATNILSEYKQAELKWIPLAFSVSFNIAQGLQGLEYGLNDL